MAKKDEVIKSKDVEERNEYVSNAIINLGSNKNGTPKKSYKPGDKILLTKKQATVLKNQNKIK